MIIILNHDFQHQASIVNKVICFTSVAATLLQIVLMAFFILIFDHYSLINCH